MSSTTSWDRPKPGQIINYIYLWRHEQQRGQEDGRKMRPCLVVATYEHQGLFRVITAPVTTRDYAPEDSLPVPRRIAELYGLDPRSRIVFNELNEFTWVGPDVRPGPKGSPVIGKVPEALLRQIAGKIVERRVRATRRTE